MLLKSYMWTDRQTDRQTDRLTDIAISRAPMELKIAEYRVYER